MNSPIVEVEQGKLRGKYMEDYFGKPFYAFQGIPYAKPPIGELRFKSPQPPDSWAGVRDATTEGNPCYQRLPNSLCMGSEDCLFLNVYTRNLREESHELKPVMFWIHGGSFLYGSGSTDFYGPEFIMTQDIVLVTINYRLGLLGFLSLDDSSLNVPGNAGLKDQVLALKWVQRNIEQFCGDPRNVTAFGQSSGGASVHYLLLSPLSTGLFHKAIIQSGTSFDSWTRGQDSTKLLAKALDINPADLKTILAVLMQMPIEDVYNLQQKIPDEQLPCKVRAFGMVIESPSREAFVSEDPIRLIAAGRYHKVPIIMGYNSREGIYSAIQTKAMYGEVKLTRNFERAIPYITRFESGSEVSRKVAAQIKEFYYGDEAPSLHNINQFYLLQTDNLFAATLQLARKYHSKTSEQPLYFYRFSLNSSLNVYKKIAKYNYAGACHGDEIGYIFKNKATRKTCPGSIEDEGVRQLTQLWTNFARYGNPNGHSDVAHVTWLPVRNDKFNYLEIGENLTVGTNPDQTRMELWNKIFNLSSAVPDF